eukprot:COSAG06_NODE_3137_length_5802_cov_19.787480_3_plen_129_part_00
MSIDFMDGPYSTLGTSAKSLHGWMGVCVLRSRVRGCRVSVARQCNGPNTDVSLLGVTRPLRTPESHRTTTLGWKQGGQQTRVREGKRERKRRKKSKKRNELRHLQRARTKDRAERSQPPMAIAQTNHL